MKEKNSGLMKIIVGWRIVADCTAFILKSCGWRNQVAGLQCNNGRCKFVIGRHLLMNILQFQEFYLIVTALGFTVLHAAVATGMSFGRCVRKLNAGPHLFAHAIMYLQHQSAGDAKIHAGDNDGQNLFHTSRKSKN